MPSDALIQFLAKRAELKCNLVTCETSGRAGDRLGASDATELRVEAIRREIAAYERAITMLIPRRLDA